MSKSLSALCSLACLLAAACGGASATDPGMTASNSQALVSSAAAPASAPNLGAATSYAILGGPAVTCTTSSVVGDVGAGSPGAPVTQTLCPVTGAVHAGDAAAAAAYNDFLLAWLAVAAQPCSTDPTHTLTGTLSNVTLAPGVYCFDAAAALTGVLTLDGQGDPNASWTFKVGSGPIGGALTGTGFSVVMANGGAPCNVLWWVAGATTMTNSSFVGTILSGAGITFTGAGSFTGRALAKAAVTVTSMTSFGTCGGSGSGGGGGGTGGGCSSSGDRVTGGGFIVLASGGKGTFAVSGGVNRGGFDGRLEYNDHAQKNGVKVKGTGLTQYLVVDAVTRHLEGTADVNHVAGFTYQVDVADNGEPGKSDTFSLRLFDAKGALAYSASGRLAGGIPADS